MSDTKNNTQRVRDVSYEDFLENPRSVVRHPSENSFRLVDKNGRQRGFLGEVSNKDDSCPADT